jgi:hypothetical protein
MVNRRKTPGHWGLTMLKSHRENTKAKEKQQEL